MNDVFVFVRSGLSEATQAPTPAESSVAQRGVQPVYLKCSQGSVTWLYPRGALRVVLRYGTGGKDFQVRK